MQSKRGGWSGVFFACRYVAVVVMASICASACLTGSAAAVGQPPFRLVILDAGHGGKDEGAKGLGGLLEKEVVLDVAQRLGRLLVARNLRVIHTRERDDFVPLEVRTSRANDARGDLFISIHANSSPIQRAKGIETYFVSLEASDAAARRVADRENEALTGTGPAAPAVDPFLALLGDMISTDHMAESNVFAKLAQTRLAKVVDSESRGVKQAPFVVLMGVQMPAVLIEIGFLSNDEDAGALSQDVHRDRIADALADAIVEFGKRYDARRGLAAASR